MKKTSDRILTAIFCDDIRHEVGNKISYMGCYQSELFVPSAPIALTKFCIQATALTPIARPFKSLAFRVILDDETELARLEIPPQALSDGAQVDDPTATRKSVSTALMFAPFFIEKPTSVRLMADTDEGEIVGPRLLIKVMPDLGPTATPVIEEHSPAENTPTKKRSRKSKQAESKA